MTEIKFSGYQVVKILPASKCEDPACSDDSSIQRDCTITYAGEGTHHFNPCFVNLKAGEETVEQGLTKTISICYDTEQVSWIDMYHVHSKSQKPWRILSVRQLWFQKIKPSLWIITYVLPNIRSKSHQTKVIRR